MNRFEFRPAGPANPFEGFLLFVAVIQGFLVLSGTAKPTSLLALLPDGFRLMWAGLLFFGGMVSLAGLYWPGNPFTGVEVKRVGLLACAFPTLAYALALFNLGSVGIVAGTQSLLFAAACFWRIHQVGRALNSARQRINDTEPHLPLDIDPMFDTPCRCRGEKGDGPHPGP